MRTVLPTRRSDRWHWWVAIRPAQLPSEWTDGRLLNGPAAGCQESSDTEGLDVLEARDHLWKYWRAVGGSG